MAECNQESSRLFSSNTFKNHPPSTLPRSSNHPPSTPIHDKKPPAKYTIDYVVPSRSSPRSAAKPPADGAARIVACGRRMFASMRGPHSRGFAREPPHKHTPDGSSLADLCRATCGGSRTLQAEPSECGPARCPGHAGDRPRSGYAAGRSAVSVAIPFLQ